MPRFTTWLGLLGCICVSTTGGAARLPHGLEGTKKRVAATNRTPAPNIVIYLVDDAGWNLFNFGGAEPHNSHMLTPTVEALAQSGVVLDRHYTFVPGFSFFVCRVFLCVCVGDAGRAIALVVLKTLF